MRQLIVLDCETLGLDDDQPACEVAWENYETGETGWFLPELFPSDWIYADPEALKINRWFERGLNLAPQDVDMAKTRQLHDQISGNTLGGSNPGFDAKRLTMMFLRAGLPAAPWHHRLCDLSNQASSVLGLGYNDLPGLARVCELLGLPGGDHSARGDVRATVACFRKLDELRARRVAA